MDYKEYNQAVDKYSDGLYTFLLKMTKNREDAEDILQETFKRLWANRKKVELKKAKSYLFTVAYHLFIDMKRRSKFTGDADDYVFDNQYYLMKQPDIKDIINIAVDKLPDIQKTVLLLRDYEGYSYKEIAQMTGLNENQVKVYIFRARKKLREFIGKVENVI